MSTNLVGQQQQQLNPSVLKLSKKSDPDNYTRSPSEVNILENLRSSLPIDYIVILKQNYIITQPKKYPNCIIEINTNQAQTIKVILDSFIRQNNQTNV